MEDEIIIDLQKLVLALRKNFKYIIVGTIICVVFGVIYLLLATPVYESSALLRIKPPQDVDKSLLKSTPLPDAQRSRLLMTTYTEILKSNTVISPVLEKMQQVEKDEEQGQHTKYKVNVESVRDTDIVKLSVQSNDPEKAKQANDLIVKNFLHRLTELSQTEDKKGRSFIEKRRGIALKNLNAAEKKLSDFRKKNKYVDSSVEIALIRAQSEKIVCDIDNNKLDLIAAQAKLKEANSKLSELESSVPSNDIIAKYEQKISELTAKRLEYIGKYGEWHPDVVQLDDELMTLKERLEAEIARISDLNIAIKQEVLSAKFENELAVENAQSRLQKLAKLDEENTKQIRRLADLARQYEVLVRDINSARDIYNMLNRRLEEARVAEASFATEVQVLNPAALNQVPIKPRKTFTMILAVCIGLFGSSGLVVCREIIKQNSKNTSKTGDIT